MTDLSRTIPGLLTRVVCRPASSASLSCPAFTLFSANFRRVGGEKRLPRPEPQNSYHYPRNLPDRDFYHNTELKPCSAQIDRSTNLYTLKAPCILYLGENASMQDSRPFFARFSLPLACPGTTIVVSASARGREIKELSTQHKLVNKTILFKSA